MRLALSPGWPHRSGSTHEAALSQPSERRGAGTTRCPRQPPPSRPQVGTRRVPKRSPSLTWPLQSRCVCLASVSVGRARPPQADVCRERRAARTDSKQVRQGSAGHLLGVTESPQGGRQTRPLPLSPGACDDARDPLGLRGPHGLPPMAEGRRFAPPSVRPRADPAGQQGWLR